MIAAGVRFGCVVGGCRLRTEARRFRQGLTARKLSWAVGIPGDVKVYPADVQMIHRPVARRGRPPQRIPDALSVAAEDVLTTAKWQNISWRTGTKGKLRARSAAVRVRVADGSPQRISTRRINICQGSKLGSSANTGLRESGNTISPTYPRRLTFALWQPRSRRDGSASRHTSS